MGRVEDVKKELQPRGFDKSAPTVIQVDGYKCGEGCSTACKERIRDRSLHSRLISEQVDHKDQDDPCEAIICLQQRGGNGYERHDAELLELAVDGFICIDESQTQQQSEVDILPAEVKETAAAHQIKGNFGNECKNQKADGVFLFVSRVVKAFSNQKAEDREGQPADFAQHPVQSYRSAQDAERNAQYLNDGVKDHRPVINKHA